MVVWCIYIGLLYIIGKHDVHSQCLSFCTRSMGQSLLKLLVVCVYPTVFHYSLSSSSLFPPSPPSLPPPQHLNIFQMHNRNVFEVNLPNKVTTIIEVPPEGTVDQAIQPVLKKHGYSLDIVELRFANNLKVTSNSSSLSQKTNQPEPSIMQCICRVENSCALASTTFFDFL